MISTFSFGSYLPGDSPLHRMDPRAKLLLGCAFIIIALVAQDFAALGVCVVFVLAFYGIARLPFGKAVRSIGPLAVIAVVAAILNLFVVQGGEVLFQWGFVRISEAGVHQCLLVAARVLTMLLAMSLVTMTTTTLDITEAFESLLGPLSRIGFPAHEVSMVMGIALRFLPQFVQEFATIYQAQVSRGAKLAESPRRGALRMLTSLMVPLFTSAFRHAETLSLAMDARCYHGDTGRTRLAPLRYAPRDAVACAVVAAMLVCVLAVNGLV